MGFLKNHLDKLGLTVLTGYVLFLTFAVLDEQMGWEILIDFF